MPATVEVVDWWVLWAFNGACSGAGALLLAALCLSLTIPQITGAFSNFAIEITAIRWRSSDCLVVAGEITLVTQLPLGSILRHYVHILSVPVIVCNIPFHFWALGAEF
ncbi:hypothetical protein [Tychonema sp. BBK16]|uniref:hypothetical protein n=1 Tax=Tychonema sp. BBK16 TaxID=2699888 RepID=UPI001F162B55|nr:hypothetical protein [Tychonema sp. BBK16]MCF6375716.1 hypothetical protein [Tychonema sp. BBK16]